VLLIKIFISRACISIKLVHQTYLKILFVLYMSIFFACLYALFLRVFMPFRVQRKRTSSEAPCKGHKRRKKRQPVTRRFAAGPPLANYPVLLKITGRCETPLTSHAIPVIFPLLGCVIWQERELVKSI
jgi:hypothetical protein